MENKGYIYGFRNLDIDWDKMGMSNERYNEGVFFDVDNNQVKVINGLLLIKTKNGKDIPMCWMDYTCDKKSIKSDFFGYTNGGEGILYQDYGLCIKSGDVFFFNRSLECEELSDILEYFGKDVKSKTELKIEKELMELN